MFEFPPTKVEVGKRVGKSYTAIWRLAAAGVDIWVAGLKEGYYASGTSYAAPWVSAAVAGYLAQGKNSAYLLNHAQDLGVPGVDKVFGAGLLQFSSLLK